MRHVGCFMKRKLVSDLKVVKQIKHCLKKNKVICQIYPEARYALVGTTSVLPDSLGKLVKKMQVPVVTLISHGNTIFSHIPDWFEWQRKEVRQEILSGDYCEEMDVVVDLLQNSDGFYRIGQGKLID